MIHSILSFDISNSPVSMFGFGDVWWSRVFYLTLTAFCCANNEKRQATFARKEKDFRLADFLISEEETFTLTECALKCITTLQQDLCKSFNFQKMGNPLHICQLNNAVLPKMKKKALISAQDDLFDYYEMVESFKGERIEDGTSTLCRSALFPVQSTLFYIQSHGYHPEMTSITTCFWIMMSEDMQNQHYLSFVSYAVRESFDEFWVGFHSYTVSMGTALFGTTSEGTKSVKNILDNVWHSICVTWTNVDGSYSTYIDGDVENTGTGFEKDHVIRGGGIWILGQEQDSYGGGFDVLQMFIGQMTQVNIWDRVLSSAEISELKSHCNHVSSVGIIKPWSDFITGFSKNMSSVEIPECC